MKELPETTMNRLSLKGSNVEDEPREIGIKLEVSAIDQQINLRAFD
jgi:hypothetical protein